MLRKALGMKPDEVTDEVRARLSIAARYPDYKRVFKKTCTRSFAEMQLKRMEEFRLCILKQL
jgi:hypothetical protein